METLEFEEVKEFAYLGTPVTKTCKYKEMDESNYPPIKR